MCSQLLQCCISQQVFLLCLNVRGRWWCETQLLMQRQSCVLDVSPRAVGFCRTAHLRLWGLFFTAVHHVFDDRPYPQRVRIWYRSVVHLQLQHALQRCHQSCGCLVYNCAPASLRDALGEYCLGPHGVQVAQPQQRATGCNREGLDSGVGANVESSNLYSRVAPSVVVDIRQAVGQHRECKYMSYDSAT
eukprot:3427599-Rhodomonas_salina.1